MSAGSRSDDRGEVWPPRPAAAGVGTPDGPEVELVRVTSHGWRICDRRVPSGHPSHVLGFVERRGDVYETMQFGEGFESHEASSVEGAVELILSTLTARARHGGEPEATW